MNLEVCGGGAFEVATGLHALTRSRVRTGAAAQLRMNIAAWAPGSAELWLHLVGVAYESRPPTAPVLLRRLRRMDPSDLRRQLLGWHVPAWRRYVPAEVFAAALDRDSAAARELLRTPRYYAGRARAALRRVLLDPPDQTQRVITGFVARWLEIGLDPARVRRLAADIAAAQEIVHAQAPQRAVETVTRGYRHTREPGIRRVVLVPTRHSEGGLTFSQHRDARIVLYVPREGADDATARLAEFGHALGDVQRMTILQLLRDQPLTLTEVAEKTGQPRTSVHHHLSVLRESGLISVGRDADRHYRYAFLPSGFAAALDTASATFPTPH